MIKAKTLFLSFFILACVTFLLSLGLGDYHLSLKALVLTLLGDGSSLDKIILFSLRLPRTLSAFVTGGLLALAGALMQVLLRNPLADPYILGISGGSAVTTLGAMMLGLTGVWLTGAAFCGALLAILLVFLLARGAGQWSPVRLLLTGVVLAAGWGAIVTFILTVSPNRMLHSLLFWLIGDLSSTQMPLLGSIILLIGFIVSFFIAQPLNILSRGELQARTLGVNTKQINLIIFLLSALLTATAVSIGGTIGFIGLIVPHIIRLLVGSDHKTLIPASILLGGILLMVADMVARTIIAPLQLPVGIFTAFIGVPLFLFLLNRSYQ